MGLFAKQRNLYTLYGALFGALFPAIAAVFVFVIPGGIDYLFWIILTAPLFLGVFARFAGIRQDSINVINQGLEQTVRDRTASIQAMLDVTGQGLLAVDENMRVGQDFSAPSETIFGTNPAGRKIGALMFPDGEGREDFEQGLGMVLSGAAKPEVIFDLLEKKILLGGRSYEVDYRSVGPKSVMISYTDVTLAEEVAEREREDEYRRSLVYHVVNRLDHFSSLERQAGELFERLDLALAQGQDPDKVLLELMHTFKANCSFFGFARSTQVVHEAETAIGDALTLGEDPELREWGTKIRETYYGELEIARQTLGEEILEGADSVRVPRDYYRKIMAYVRKKYPADRTLDKSISHFHKIPFSTYLTRLDDLVGNLARRQGKKVLPLDVEGGDFLVHPEPYERVAETFSHIARNMVTHGIESPPERKRNGKPEEGRIAIKVEKENRRIAIDFIDDGRGISPLQLKSKAMEAGILTGMDEIPDESALALVFHPGLSTALLVDDTSGRGMGLSAVKASVEQMGGSVSVTSALDKGTTLRVYLPNVS